MADDIDTMTHPHVFCFGMGYSARHLALQLAAQGWRVGGTARTPEGSKAIAQDGFDAFVFDGSAPGEGVREALQTATHIVVSAPPGETGDPVLAQHGEDIAQASHLKWIGYLSTIGVYGDHKGAWVDETAQPTPVSARSRRRAEAESAWLALGERCGMRVQVFRLSGIYGPGRSAIDRLKAGTAQRIIKPDQVFNRIHVDDIATTLLAAIEGRGSHAIYNVTDDEPAPPQDVITFAADLLQMPPPPEIPIEEAQLSLMAKSFYVENKRASNARLHSDLGVDLKFPSYREGLRAILARGA
jgi:nucleoside-diphosphate-sugar epimerase